MMSCTTTGLSTVGTSTSTFTLADKQFVAQAASSSMLEVRASEIALERAANLQVRELAKRIRHHHLNSKAELWALATQNRAAVPTAMTAEHKALVNQIARLNAPQFDKAYVQQMEVVYEQDVKLYRALVNTSPSVPLRSFALKTIPVLQGHLKMATQLKNILP